MSRKISFLFILLALLIVPLTVAQEADETFAITILHTNDTHASHEPQSNGNGGVARQAAVVNQIRDDVDNSLLLDAGDRFTGTLFHRQYLGQDQVQVMNLLDYDAMALGNHEFDNGDNILAEFIDNVDFPVLSANIDFSASPYLADKVEPYVVLEVGGEQIGVIGLTVAETQTIASPGPELVWSDDYIGIANEAAAAMSEQGINKIILLTHNGIEIDLETVEQFENIDLVIGGHSHTLYSNMYAGAEGPYPLEFTSASDEPIYYVQASEKNIYLGRLNLEFDADGIVTSAAGDVILLSGYITPDPQMASLVEELAVPVREMQNTVIGATSEVLLVGDRNVCRVEECNLGNLIADGLRAETGAQIAIMNSGGIRADIEPGEITLGDVLTVQPFNNLVSQFQLKGSDVIAALEIGVSTITVEDGMVVRAGAPGRFPQVSGMRYTIDPTLEAGNRIVSVEVLNEAGEYELIDEEAIYDVVSINFVRQGGDGYTVLAENAINPYDFGRSDYEVLADFLTANSPINYETEGRITYVNAEVEPLP